MAYDETLADRVRSALADHAEVSERRMFGGLAFMVRNGMAVGILGDDLIVRVGRDTYEEALATPHARPMDFTGRPMRGIVFVGPAGTSSDEDLARWVSRGAAYAASEADQR